MVIIFSRPAEVRQLLISRPELAQAFSVQSERKNYESLLL